MLKIRIEARANELFLEILTEGVPHQRENSGGQRMLGEKSDVSTSVADGLRMSSEAGEVLK